VLKHEVLHLVFRHLFREKFKEDPDPKNHKEFKMDTELADKFERWADMFMAMIIENHKHTDLRNIPEPMEVRIATESYKKNNDVIGQYVEEKMVKDDSVTEKVMLQSAFTNFKVWAFQNVPKGKKDSGSQPVPGVPRTYLWSLSIEWNGLERNSLSPWRTSGGSRMILI